MFKQMVRGFYYARYAGGTQLIMGNTQSPRMVILFRRNLRNIRSQLPPTDSVQSSNSINKEIAIAAELEGKLFGTSDNSIEPAKSDDLEEKRTRIKEWNSTKNVSPSQKKTHLVKGKSSSSSPIVRDTELGLEYIKLSLNDPMLSKLILTAKSRKHRDRTNQIIVEGRRLILEAIESRCRLQSLLFSQKEQLALIRDKLRALKKTKFIKVPQQDLKVWSTLSSCPGILGIFDRPDNDSGFIRKAPALPITVICDNIREPNNLGSIIRSCAAIPCSEMIILKGCCDPWESKALRGGCGGQFRVKIRYGSTWEQLDKLLPEDYQFFIAESKVNRMKMSEGQNMEIYSNIRVSGSHNVLVIGGETHGVSDEAYEFLATNKDRGTCLHIPLAAGVESLNTASAVTLILFEMRKLLLDKKGTLENEDSV